MPKMQVSLAEARIIRHVRRAQAEAARAGRSVSPEDLQELLIETLADAEGSAQAIDAATASQRAEAAAAKAEADAEAARRSAEEAQAKARAAREAAEARRQAAAAKDANKAAATLGEGDGGDTNDSPEGTAGETAAE